jgi:hypothetical protein
MADGPGQAVKPWIAARHRRASEECSLPAVLSVFQKGEDDEQDLAMTCFPSPMICGIRSRQSPQRRARANLIISGARPTPMAAKAR